MRVASFVAGQLENISMNDTSGRISSSVDMSSSRQTKSPRSRGPGDGSGRLIMLYTCRSRPTTLDRA
jgi:hypothetical protein